MIARLAALVAVVGSTALAFPAATGEANRPQAKPAQHAAPATVSDHRR